MGAEDKVAAEGEPVGFLARWGRRKAEARADASAAAPAKQTATPTAPAPASAEAQPHGEAATLAAPAADLTTVAAPGYADVDLLTQSSDYTRFMGRDVDAGVQRAAMKKLFFSDPHFNVMDGLDTYIDDYSQPDPIPLSMLRQLHQSKALGLFELEFELEEEQEKIAAQQDLTPLAMTPLTISATATPSTLHDDDHADLRLQQDDAAGRPGPESGAGA